MILDSLTITHSNGRVSRITEKAPTNLLTGTFEIVQNGRHSYYYDNAGSLTRDVLRNITIHNDINGNPDFITFGGGSEIESGYTTGGQKLWTVHRTAAGFIPSDVLSDPNKPKPTPEIGNTPSQYSRLSDYLIQNVGVTRYYDGYEFYDRNLTEGKFYFSNGYVSFHSDGSFDYSAIITDYRGSTRVVMTFDSTLNTSNIVQANSYYPSGALVTDVQTSIQLGSTSGGVQTHKFLGKELDRMYGLDWYDLGARRYDAAAETFWAMDPLCEQYYHINPYAYCAGDPVNYVDTDGRIIRVANNRTNGIEDVAKIAATSIGCQVVSHLISQKDVYTLKSTFLTISSIYDSNSRVIYYVGNPWIKELPRDGGALNSMTAMGHELFHAFDQSCFVFNNRNAEYSQYIVEPRAVSFGNYLRKSYSLSPTRNKYGNIEGDFHQFPTKEKITDFTTLGCNSDKTSYGFSYKKATTIVETYKKGFGGIRIPDKTREEISTYYMTVSIDKNNNISFQTYNNEEAFKKATSNW